MNCHFCKESNEEELEEVNICDRCLEFLTKLKCSICHNAVSHEKKFNAICDVCVDKGEKPEKEQLERLEKLKIEEEETKNKIEKDNLENNRLNNSPIYDERKFIEFYDIILKINSIRDVLNGWNIEFSKKGKEYYEKMKVNNFLKIGVAGAGNKGKTFLLEKLTNIELPIGTSIKTEGLSIRCPDMESENQNIILLDSAGSETPLLEDSNFDFNKYISKPKELKEQLENLARDKSLTENFLQNIIINESNMLLIVVGNLTYQEQKLINKIKEETDSSNNSQNLYVIHNLQTFVEKSQVEKYINETLLKSATFRLQKNKEIKIKSDKKNNQEQTENDVYYIEEILTENHKNVYHLIMAREKSNAGNYYNNFVIRFLRNQMNNFPQQTSFPIVERIKDYFFKRSKNYLESPLKLESFEESEDSIKIKKDTELKLKKIMVDEMGISNFIGNSYNPKYCYFIHKNRFYFQIELPGKFDKKQFKYTIYVKDKYYIIDISACKNVGSKNFFPKEKTERKFYNNREDGPFHLRFSVLTEDIQFKEKKIKLVKPPKKNEETKKDDENKKNDENPQVNSKKKKKEKEKENEKSEVKLEEEDIKPEEGVLTFYIELQDEPEIITGQLDSDEEN